MCLHVMHERFLFRYAFNILCLQPTLWLISDQRPWQLQQLKTLWHYKSIQHYNNKYYNYTKSSTWNLAALQKIKNKIKIVY